MSQEYSRIYGEMRKLYTESISTSELEEGLDPVGQEDSDIDNDGKSNTRSDKYLLKRRKVRSSEIARKTRTRERTDEEFMEYYDWRSTVSEDIQAAIDDLNSDQIVEKPVNNYAKGKNGKRVVVINPTIEFREEVEAMGGELISSSDIEEISEIAAEYFVENGLNESDVLELIKDLGEEEFCERVLDIVEETMLTEARAAKKRKGGKSYEEIKAEIDAREKNKKSKIVKNPQGTKSRPPGQERIIRGAQQVLQKANAPETKKAVAKSVANTLSRAALSAWEGHKAAMQSKKEGRGLAQQLGRGAGATVGAFLKKGTAHLREYIEFLESEGYDLSEISLQDLYENLDYLEEKAVSEQQQKIFGLALSVKRGETPRSQASKQVLDIVDSMSETEIRKFAKTKHKGIPKQVKEGLSYEDIIRFMGNR